MRRFADSSMRRCCELSMRRLADARRYADTPICRLHRSTDLSMHRFAAGRAPPVTRDEATIEATSRQA
jgi:hypothetical protein